MAEPFYNGNHLSTGTNWFEKLMGYQAYRAAWINGHHQVTCTTPQKTGDTMADLIERSYLSEIMNCTLRRDYTRALQYVDFLNQYREKRQEPQHIPCRCPADHSRSLHRCSNGCWCKE